MNLTTTDATQEANSTGMWKLVGGHIVALAGAVAVLGATFYMFLAHIDPYASHTNAQSAQTGASYVLLVYSAFAIGVHGLKRAMSGPGIPMRASIYTWAVLVLPPVVLVALIGLGSSY